MDSARVHQRLLQIVEEGCAVCMNPFTLKRKRVVVCPSEHPICFECTRIIEKELSWQRRCPICRYQFDPKQVRVHRMQMRILEDIAPDLKMSVITKQQQKIYEDKQEVKRMESPNPENKEQEGEAKGVYFEEMALVGKLQGLKAKEKLKKRVRQLDSARKIEDIIAELKSQIEEQLSRDQQQLQGELAGLGIYWQVQGLYKGMSMLEILTEMNVCIIDVATSDLLAFCCIYSQQTQQHLKWFNQMVDKYSKFLQLRFGRGCLLYTCENFTQSYDDFKQCTVMYSDNERVLCAVALNSLRMHNQSELKYILRQILALNPKNRVALILQAISHKPNFKAAIKQLEGLLVEFPSDVALMVEVGIAYRKDQQYYEAEKYFKQVKELRPAYRPVYYHLGANYLDLNKQYEAKQYFQKYKQTKGRYSRVLDSLIQHKKGLISLKYPLYQVALDHLLKAYELNETADTLSYITECYWNKSCWEQALKTAKQMEVKFPGLKDNLHLQAACYKKMFKEEQEIKCLQDSISICQHQSSYERLIEIYSSKRNYQIALSYAQQWWSVARDKSKAQRKVTHLEGMTKSCKK